MIKPGHAKATTTHYFRLCICYTTFPGIWLLRCGLRSSIIPKSYLACIQDKRNTWMVPMVMPSFALNQNFLFSHINMKVNGGIFIVSTSRTLNSFWNILWIKRIHVNIRCLQNKVSKYVWHNIKIILQLSTQITSLQSSKNLLCNKLNGYYTTRILTLTQIKQCDIDYFCTQAYHQINVQWNDN